MSLAEKEALDAPLSAAGLALAHDVYHDVHFEFGNDEEVSAAPPIIQGRCRMRFHRT